MNLLKTDQAKKIVMQEAFEINDEISLVLPEIEVKIKLYANVVALGNGSIDIKIPECSWSAVEIKKGLQVVVMNSKNNQLLYAEGKIKDIFENQPANIRIRLDQKTILAERRQFFRFSYKRSFELLPMGNSDAKQTSGSLKAVSKDLSLGGLGFMTKKKLDLGKSFLPMDLFDESLQSETKPGGISLDILWSKGNPLIGYHYGALFKFKSKREHETFSWIVDQLQINHLAHQYQKLD